MTHSFPEQLSSDLNVDQVGGETIRGGIGQVAATELVHMALGGGVRNGKGRRHRGAPVRAPRRESGTVASPHPDRVRSGVVVDQRDTRVRNPKRLVVQVVVIVMAAVAASPGGVGVAVRAMTEVALMARAEEHTREIQSLKRTSH